MAIIPLFEVRHLLSMLLDLLGASGMNVTPLWWALAFGAGFGGNGTIVGSTVNIIVTDLSEKTRTPINPEIWNR